MTYDSYDEKESIQIKILNNAVSLDRPCWKCTRTDAIWASEGALRITELEEEFENGEHCSVCNNRRFTLTDAGEAVMNLVKRHLK